MAAWTQRVEGRVPRFLPEFKVGHEVFHTHVVHQDEVRLPELQALMFGHTGVSVVLLVVIGCSEGIIIQGGSSASNCFR